MLAQQSSSLASLRGRQQATRSSSLRSDALSARQQQQLQSQEQDLSTAPEGEVDESAIQVYLNYIKSTRRGIKRVERRLEELKRRAAAASVPEVNATMHSEPPEVNATINNMSHEVNATPNIVPTEILE